jgi:hypothetical protein
MSDSDEPVRNSDPLIGGPFIAALVIAVIGTALWFRGRPQISHQISTTPVQTVKPLTIYTNGNQPENIRNFRPVVDHREGYIGSDSCVECHQQNHESWHHSYHRSMTQEATADRVMADFDNVVVRVGPKNEEYRLTQSQGLCWVEMGPQEDLSFDSPSGRKSYPVVMTTGSHHMQIYWFPIGGDRSLGMLPIVYLKQEQRWIPRTAAFLRPHTDLFSVEPTRWNVTCVHCHSTHGDTDGRLVYGQPMFNTRVAEFGISCEACHGPAETHVALHKANPTRLPENSSDPIVNPANLPHDLSAQVCGGCHSIYVPHVRSMMHRAGDPLARTRRISRRDQATAEHIREQNKAHTDDIDAFVESTLDGSFWGDGMVRVSGREYNGMIETACHTLGTMSCLSCHNLHKSGTDPRSYSEWADDQLKPGFRNQAQACLQCHDEQKFSTPTHTHHQSGSTGSACYNCHMPHTTYGVMKAMRSHTISSPNVRESVVHGRPNACNLCHLDKTLEWSAIHLQSWYGQPSPSLNSDQRAISAAAAWALEGDAGQRALIAWHMGWKPAQETSKTDWLTPYLGTLMDDPYDTVRYLAHRSLGTLNTNRNSYDFVGPPVERTVAVREIGEDWARRPHPAPPAGVLIDSNGKIMREEFDRLLRRRDQRRVILDE